MATYGDIRLIYTQRLQAHTKASQTKAAQALGQLLFYEYKVSQEDKPTSLFLLFDKKPEKETIDYVKQYKVTIIYESGDSFKHIDWDSQVILKEGQFIRYLQLRTKAHKSHLTNNLRLFVKQN